MSDTTLPPPPPNPDDGRSGRKPKCTDQIIQAASVLLLQGNFRCVVADRLNIGGTTFRRWMRMGKQYPNGRYGRFRTTVVTSETEFQARSVAAITNAGMTEDPWVLLAFLERKYPKLYGKYRGELGELKKRIAELEKLLGAEPSEIADSDAA